MQATIVDTKTNRPHVSYNLINNILSKINSNVDLKRRLTPWTQLLIFQWNQPTNHRVVESTCKFDSSTMQISTVHAIVEHITTLNIDNSSDYSVHVVARQPEKQSIPNVVTDENIISVSIVQRQSLLLSKCSYHFDMVWSSSTKDAAERLMATTLPNYVLTVETFAEDVNYLSRKMAQCWSSAVNLPCVIKQNE